MTAVSAAGDPGSPSARRVRSAGAILFDLVMLAFVVLIVVTAVGLRPGARLVPLSVGLPTIALLVLQLALDLRGRVPLGHAGLGGTDLSRASLSEVIEAAREEEAEEAATHGGEDMRRQAVFAAWTVAYIGLGIATNFLVATPIAVGVILLISRVQPVLAVILAGATGLGVWLVFDLLLQVRF